MLIRGSSHCLSNLSSDASHPVGLVVNPALTTAEQSDIAFLQKWQGLASFAIFHRVQWWNSTLAPKVSLMPLTIMAKWHFGTSSLSWDSTLATQVPFMPLTIMAK